MTFSAGDKSAIFHCVGTFMVVSEFDQQSSNVEELNFRLIDFHTSAIFEMLLIGVVRPVNPLLPTLGRSKLAVGGLF